MNNCDCFLIAKYDWTFEIELKIFFSLQGHWQQILHSNNYRINYTHLFFFPIVIIKLRKIVWSNKSSFDCFDKSNFFFLFYLIQFLFDFVFSLQQQEDNVYTKGQASIYHPFHISFHPSTQSTVHTILLLSCFILFILFLFKLFGMMACRFHIVSLIWYRKKFFFYFHACCCYYCWLYCDSYEQHNGVFLYLFNKRNLRTEN